MVESWHSFPAQTNSATARGGSVESLRPIVLRLFSYSSFICRVRGRNDRSNGGARSP